MGCVVDEDGRGWGSGSVADAEVIGRSGVRCSCIRLRSDRGKLRLFAVSPPCQTKALLEQAASKVAGEPSHGHRMHSERRLTSLPSGQRKPHTVTNYCVHQINQQRSGSFTQVPSQQSVQPSTVELGAETSAALTHPRRVLCFYGAYCVVTLSFEGPFCICNGLSRAVDESGLR